MKQILFSRVSNASQNKANVFLQIHLLVFLTRNYITNAGSFIYPWSPHALLLRGVLTFSKGFKQFFHFTNHKCLSDDGMRCSCCLHSHESVLAQQAVSLSLWLVVTWRYQVQDVRINPMFCFLCLLIFCLHLGIIFTLSINWCKCNPVFHKKKPQMLSKI